MGATSSDDPAHSTWFDTRGTSRILVDLGRRMRVSRINVFSWHAGPLAPQRYTLWATDREELPEAEVSRPELPSTWKRMATVDSRSLGDGGKHGSSLNAKQGAMGSFRYLLLELPANRPDWSRSGFLSEIDVFSAEQKPDVITVPNRKSGVQELKFGGMNRQVPFVDETPFLLAGSKLYEFGAMDGTFPRIGRMEGEQGGVWCHPIKLLDSFGFVVLEAGQQPWRLVGPDRFEHGFASAAFHFERRALQVSRRDVVAEDKPALISSVTLRNTGEVPRQVSLQFRGAVNLRPSYESRLSNGPDRLELRGGVVEATDVDHPLQWAVVFGADRTPSKSVIEGTNGVQTYEVKLPPHAEETLRFIVAGEPYQGLGAARARFASVRRTIPETIRKKEALYRERILGGVRFTCSESSIDQAFLSAKANVMLSRMDLRPGYPAPFLAAGFPIYTWLFGCDSLHSTAGVAAAGFDEAARDTLTCLLHFADLKKQGAHEVASNGRLLGWDHIQETPQLVHACWNHFLWTRDADFLRKALPVCEAILEHVVTTADTDHDGFLEGPALMEQDGMGRERIDSVCQLFAAYESLALMQEALGRPGSERNRLRAAKLKSDFNRDWWNPAESMWACSLREDHSQTMDHFWAVVFPQQVGIADRTKGPIAMDRIEREWVNDRWGMVAQRKDVIAGEGVGVVHNNVLAQTAFAFERADLGWKLIQLSAKAPLQERMLGAFDETMPGGGDLVQLWSFGPFLEAVIGGLAGIKPQPAPHRVDFFPQLPRGLDWFRVDDCRIGDHTVALEHRRIAGGARTVLKHVRGNAVLSGLLWISKEAGVRVTQSGRTVEARLRRLPISDLERLAVDYSLAPGESLTLSITPSH